MMTYEDSCLHYIHKQLININNVMLLITHHQGFVQDNFVPVTLFGGLVDCNSYIQASTNTRVTHIFMA